MPDSPVSNEAVSPTPGSRDLPLRLAMGHEADAAVAEAEAAWAAFGDMPKCFGDPDGGSGR